MDVYDFLGGDVTVEVNEGKELLVEGKAKKQDGGSVATISFRQRFSLPHYVDLDGIRSAMSSDGVLTIISPKKQASSQSDSLTKEMLVERGSRIDSQCDGGRSWAEKNVRESTKESEGCSSRTISSNYQSHQEYSSNSSF